MNPYIPKSVASRLLVTGADGFIGQNFRQVCLRNQNISVRYAARNLSSKTLSPQDYVESGEAFDSTEFSEALAQSDTLIHLAGLAHIPVGSSEVDDKKIDAGHIGLMRDLIERMQKSAIKQLIYVSSAKVMGESSEYPFTESCEPNPIDPYAASKWRAEQLLRDSANELGFQYTVIRPPLVYGSGVKANFCQLIRLAASPLPLPFASVNNRRSLVFVDNLVDALLTCVDNPAAFNETFFVSDGMDLSTAALIAELREAMGRKAGLFPVPLAMLKATAKLTRTESKMNRLIQNFQIDTSFVQQKLGWQPPFSVKQGIAATLTTL